MKEVKSPKRPLIFYYGIVLVVLLVFNLFITPMLAERQVKEVDYGTFMKMTEDKDIGRYRSTVHRSHLRIRRRAQSTRPDSCRTMT